MYKLILVLLLFCLRAGAQEKMTPTDHFLIDGKVRSEVNITLAEIMAMPAVHIDSCVIKNHLMQKRYTLRNIEGVPLKNILAKVAIASDDPKQLSEYYFVFIASDNYKVVFSWNELYNSSTGDNVYIVKSRDGQDLENDAISTICISDQAIGRRFVKALKEIRVERVN
jgi:hypothetical protein